MNKTLISMVLLLCGAVWAQSESTVRKDVLLIDRVVKTSDRVVPQRGLLKADVIQQFGEPDSRHDAVGDPPISHWVYSDFTVYFENEHVIHAVINKATETESRPNIGQS